MCTVSEEPLVVAPQPPDSRPGLGTSVAFHSTRERNFRGAKGDNATVVNPRPRKEALLPEVARMALEGYSGAAIGRELGLPERTVNHWLRAVRREWKANAAEGAAEAIGIAQMRLVTAYREAMEAWRESRQERHTTTVVEIGKTSDPSGGKTTKTTLRTESPRANAALLGMAIDAAKAICLLATGDTSRAGRSSARAAGPARPEDIDRKEMDRPAADDRYETAAAAILAMRGGLMGTDLEVHPTDGDEASSDSGKIGKEQAGGRENELNAGTGWEVNPTVVDEASSGSGKIGKDQAGERESELNVATDWEVHPTDVDEASSNSGKIGKKRKFGRETEPNAGTDSKVHPTNVDEMSSGFGKIGKDHPTGGAWRSSVWPVSACYRPGAGEVGRRLLRVLPHPGPRTISGIDSLVRQNLGTILFHTIALTTEVVRAEGPVVHPAILRRPVPPY